MSTLCLRMLLLGVCAFVGFETNSIAQQCTCNNNEPYESFKCHSRLWIDAEYLYWKMKDAPAVVPLVIEGPFVPGFAPDLNTPGTEVVLGGKSIDNKWQSGGRFAMGYWYDDDHCFGWDLEYFFNLGNSKKYEVRSSGEIGSLPLAVPFFDVTTDSENSVAIAYPDNFSGLATLRVNNTMQDAEFNGTVRFWSNCHSKIYGLIGFRWWNFDERLRFFTDSPYIHIEDVYKTEDQFHAKNNFYGGQLGFDLDFSYHCFFIDVKGKVALGAMREELDIRGKLLTNDFDDFGKVQHFEGGYFALPTNIGRHKRTKFAVIPEVNVNIGYKLSERLYVKVGYTYLYVNNVLRATKQVNRNINPTQSSAIEFTPTPILVGEPSPKALHKTTSFWAQGINAGFEFHF